MTEHRYTRVAVVLHWAVAVMIVVNVALALAVDSLPDAWQRPVIDTHKSIGITVLGLVLLRLLWRLGHPPPPLPAAYAGWERRLSHAAHGLFYLLMLALPLSGWLHDSAWKLADRYPMRWFGLFEWPRIGFMTALPPDEKARWHDLLGNVHTALGYALYGLLALHIAGALKHQWLDREQQLQRMSL
ncbi:MAG: cytochrome b [Burkholderiales bacterium]|nr:cytochrome b [Burkholderiales bacterium]MDE2275256.1 cytochrome b [Burkholderiales bacterium]